MDASPYESAAQQLEDYLERIRLLLTRHIVRYWYRLTDRTGNLSDTVVSLEEVRRSLSGIASGHPPHERRGLPDLPTLEQAIEDHQAMMLGRLSASISSGLTFPCENLRAVLRLADHELDLVMLLAGLQLDVGLNRLASLAWADFTNKHPTAGFACEVLANERADQAEIRACLMPGHRLRRLRIVELVENVHFGGPHPPDLFQRLCLSGRLIAFLLGHNHDDNGYDGLDLLCTVFTPPAKKPSHLGQPKRTAKRFHAAVRHADRLARGDGSRWLTEQVPVIAVVGPDDDDHAEVAHACLGSPRPLVRVELWRTVVQMEGQSVLALSRALDESLALGAREALLREATLMVRLGNVFDDERHILPVLDALRRVLPCAGGLNLISVARMNAPLRELLGPCAEIDIRPPPPEARRALWRKSLSDLKAKPPVDVALNELADRYSTSATAITAASHRAAFKSKLAQDEAVRADDLDLAVRQRMQHQLEALATPLATALTWKDMVLPEATRSRLLDMVEYGRNKRLVHEEWGFARLNAYGHGLTALFSGPPGTGKTLSAAIIARELGSELYMIDLSKVVDKYIGETEKNLGKIFDEAERSNVVLLFDEADSLFAKRTSVGSATDRYANLEVNYLLQRMEHFPGASILTTNLATEMDDALQRRIRFRIDFRMPDVEERVKLWKILLPKEAPIKGRIHFRGLAEEFELAPAYIKNAIMRAAFQAAQRGSRIDDEMLHEAAMAEVRELGHLVHVWD